jgi:hypothetical protein
MTTSRHGGTIGATFGAEEATDNLMMWSRSVQCAVPALVSCLAVAPGCGGPEASSAPSFQDESAPTPGPGSGAQPPPSPVGAPVLEAPGTPALPGGDSAASGGDPDACLTVSTEVEIVRESVDIIIAIDNSGSMDDEVSSVEQNINVNFAAILEQSGVDYRVILVSEHRESDGQDTAVCISAPLSALASCPSDAPGPSERFFHYSTEIGSGNSLEVLLESFNGEREDEFGLAPSGWSEWLRPEAKKVFLEFTDDESNMPALEFVSSLLALSPGQFGGDPSQLEIVWHSIVGLAERPVATDPHLPTDPLEDEECEGDVVNAGPTYQELSRLTGGLRFPLCQFNGYDAVFQRIANDVLATTSGACDFAIPAPPEGRMLDLDKVAVSYRAQGGAGAPLLFGRAASEADCRADGFVVDAGGVHLCPQACEVVAADQQASIDVLFTCESTLLR